jgi:Cu(I)/Ag(I) efflux system membrane protein CusA/SilA
VGTTLAFEAIGDDKCRSAGAIMAGLLPILWSTGTGSDVMQRIAVPMVGGMISSTLLTLIVIPAVYAVVKGFAIRKAARKSDISGIEHSKRVGGLSSS